MGAVPDGDNKSSYETGSMHKPIAIVPAGIVASLSAVACAPGATVKTGSIGDRLRLRCSGMTCTAADVTVRKTPRVPQKNVLG